MKILIAEDDTSLARLAEALLRDVGHSVIRAADASQVLPSAQREKPDLILLDVNMPGGMGTEMLAGLKRGALTSTIPVVVVSGTTDPEVRAMVLRGGAEGFLQKPWVPDAFIQELQKIAPHLPW